jgi:hypothetical protein
MPESAESRRSPNSLAETNLAAWRLARHLRQILDFLGDLRAADQYYPPGPMPPDWWNGYDETIGVIPRPTRDRVIYTNRRATNKISGVLAEWRRLTQPIPMPNNDRAPIAACRAGLKQLYEILVPRPDEKRLRFGVVPRERHLLEPDPEPDDERAVLDQIRNVESARASAKGNRKGKDPALADDLARLTQPDPVRAEWPEWIKRWQLGEKSVLRLLTLLEAEPPHKADQIHAGEGVDASTRPDFKTQGAHTKVASADPPSRTVILWEGAEFTERNIRLARTRSAYLEAHGDVNAAMKALSESGHPIAKSTFYDHLKAIDTELPDWRKSTLVSGASGNPENGVRAGTRGKSRAKVR